MKYRFGKTAGRMGLLMLLSLTPVSLAAERRPAALFYGWVHSKYVVRPLLKLGIEVGSCPHGELAETLATGKYNVLVAATLNDKDRKTVQEFMARGGGVFICNPGSTHSRSKDWTATNEWLTGLGARPRWELLQDKDPKNVVRDVMGCRLSWSDKVLPPVNDGVRGVLTLMWGSTTGCEPPMSFTLGPEWQAVVTGAASMSSRPSKRHDVVLQPWIPKTGIAKEPALLAIRKVQKGRLALLAIRDYWIFRPPPNCPTAEVMLSTGAGGKPSDWLRVFANCCRWLAEPSLEAGLGGATTPESLLNPPVQVWKPLPPHDWTKMAPMHNQTQTEGLIGARTAISSGKGRPEDYIRAAKAAGLKFLVFLEDTRKMDQKGWDRLVKACDAASSKDFAAVPGLTYEDAQGNHLYAFADQVQFPKPNMLLADGRLATTQSMRSRAIFDYVNEYMSQKILSGFWRHRQNFLPVADYKLYNSFPIYSFVNGKPIDDAFGEYQYLMSLGGGHAILAFEIMTSPDEVARRAKEGWRVVVHRNVQDLRGKWHEGAWSFHGMMSQYITNGPAILAWQAPNRLVGPRGQWWRPDLWEFRLRLRAASEVGLKSVSIYDGDRLFRRWLPGGAKQFEKELVLSNCQQLGLFPVIEDMQGRKAIGMQSWNRNCIMEEFFCSDRCNFLGNARLRTRQGQQVWTQVSFQANMGITPSKGRLHLAASPATFLTRNSPTLPIDGAPAGFPTAQLRFHPQIPGELSSLFAYPVTYLVGPEIGIGQADWKLGYDPAERGAEKTPFGHPYQQPQEGWGNAWGGWHRLIPTRKAVGWIRLYACNWLPDEFRLGWHEAYLTLKEDVTVDQSRGIPVMSASGQGWTIYRGEQVIAKLEKPGKAAQGPFVPGTFATLVDKGGAVVVAAMDRQLQFRYGGHGTLALHYVPAEKILPKGTELRFKIGFAGAAALTPVERMLEFARQFGIAEPGKTAYKPKFRRGRQLSNLLLWRVEAKGGAIEARIPRVGLHGFLPVCVENLNDNWSVQLLDKARKWPNHRALPIRDGRAFGMLDLAEAGSDIFIGHPVTCNRQNVRILVSWMAPGKWFVEAHNPGNRKLKVKLRSAPGWPVFKFKKTIKLLPGASRTWQVRTALP